MICDLYPKPYTLNPKQGFTLIELLVVVAIIGLLTAAVIPAFSGFTKRQTLAQATKDLKADLRATQNRSVAGVEGLLWGIHFVVGSQTYETFVTQYSLATVKATKTLPSGVTVSAVSPNDGGSPPKANVIFNRQTGEARFFNDAGGTLTGANLTITLSLSGIPSRNVIVGIGGKIYEQ